VKELSARTRAEMVAGAKLVEASAAWALADHYEKLWHERTPEGTRVSVIAYREGDEWGLLTSASQKDQETITFPLEPAEGYPSETLTAQLTLLFG
jgi:hypothetical protein